MPDTEHGRNSSCPCGSGRKYKRCCLRKDAAARSGYTSLDRDRALEKLMRFVARDEFADHREIADQLFWGGPPPGVSDDAFEKLIASDQGQSAYYTWLAFDMRAVNGRTLLDFFLERHGDKLGSGERTYLERIRPSHLRLYEILRVVPDEGFNLRDLLSGEELFVHERMGTRQLVAWHLVAGRVMIGPNDRLVFENLPYAYPATLKPELTKALQLAQREANTGPRAGDEIALFRTFTLMLQRTWVERVAFAPLPTLTTNDGESLAFTKAVFDTTNPVRLAELLRGSTEIEEESEGSGRFVWLDKRGGSGRLLGSFVISERRLTFEAMSEGRAERGRAFVERLAGGIVTYRATRVEDARQALAHARNERVGGGTKETSAFKSKSGIPPEIEAQILLQYYEKHYGEWIDTPLPALGNRTPRHAARLKTVRPMLVALLKNMESGAEQDRRDGKPAYDFGWMWKELGIVRE
jgi:hypothetical protein